MWEICTHVTGNYFHQLTFGYSCLYWFSSKVITFHIKMFFVVVVLSVEYNSGAYVLSSTLTKKTEKRKAIQMKISGNILAST